MHRFTRPSTIQSQDAPSVDSFHCVLKLRLKCSERHALWEGDSQVYACV